MNTREGWVKWDEGVWRCCCFSSQADGALMHTLIVVFSWGRDGAGAVDGELQGRWSVLLTWAYGER